MKLCRDSRCSPRGNPAQGREASRVSLNQVSGEWPCGQPSQHPPPPWTLRPGVGSMVMEPAVSRQPLSHSVGLALLPPLTEEDTEGQRGPQL